MQKLIFHIDVNSAYLSWESKYRLEKLNEQTDLRSIPSAVGGSRENRHGIILAKSTPAKAYGIKTAETIVSALNKCPSLVLVPSRFDWYEQCSKAFIRILEQYTPDIEKVSIDEAFLDMTHTCHLFGTPMEAGDKIRRQILSELNFTVNVGISVNKLLAKMASDFEKPNLCHSLFPEEIPEKMWPLPVSRLYFVGRSAQKKMELLGIHTIGGLAGFDPNLLVSHFGVKYGTLIWEYANGRGDDNVSRPEGPNKGYGNSITLSNDVESYETACQILLTLSETVGMRLRGDHVKSNSITVEIKDCYFNSHSHQLTLSSPTALTSVIYEHACGLLKELWDGTPLRLLGIRTSKVTEEDYTQMELFETPDTLKLEKLKKVDAAVDSIRNKFGINAVKRASTLNTQLTRHGHERKSGS